MPPRIYELLLPGTALILLALGTPLAIGFGLAAADVRWPKSRLARYLAVAALGALGLRLLVGWL
jgi:hypothetical protein